MSDIRVTTLAENSTVDSELVAEWGYSLLIEAGGTRVLFDFGGGFALERNARALGLDIWNVDYAVVSHGHHDHINGMHAWLRPFSARGAQSAPIIVHPETFEPKYAREEDGRIRYTGCAYSLCELERLGAVFRFSSEPIELSRDIVTSGEIACATPYEKVTRSYHKNASGAFEIEPMRDETALYLKTEAGLIVVSGCAHRGIVNTAAHGMKLTGARELLCVIGGTHLYNASPEKLERVVADLREWGNPYVAISHCTGLERGLDLARLMPGRAFFNNAGCTWTFCGSELKRTKRD